MAILPGFDSINQGLQATNVFGPEGFLMNLIPGSQIVAMIAGAILCFTLYETIAYRGVDKLFWSQFLTLAAISLVAFGDASILPIFLVLGIGMVVLSNRAERDTPLPPGAAEVERKYVPPAVETSASNFEAQERAMVQQISKTHKPTGKQLEALRESTIATHHELTIAAAETDFAQTILQMEQDESLGDQRLGQVLQSMQQFSSNLGAHISQLGTTQQIDQVTKQALKPHVQGIAKLCGAMAKAEHELTDHRGKFIIQLAGDMNLVIGISENVTKIGKKMSKVERTVSGKLGTETITRVEMELDKKQTALKSLKRKIKNASKKKGQEEIVKNLQALQVNLEQEINQLKALIQKLKEMKATLAGAKQGVDRTLGQVNQTLSKLSNTHKKAKQHEKNLLKSHKELEKANKKLRETAKGLSAQLRAIQKAEGSSDVLPEQIIIDSATVIGDLFTEVINLQDISSKMYREGVEPLIEDMMEELALGEPLNAQLNSLTVQLFKLQAGLQKLINAAELVVKGAGKNDRDKTAILQMGQRVFAEEEKERVRLTQQALASLQRAKPVLEQLITRQQQRKEQAKRVEESIVKNLNDALSQLTRRKGQINKEFEKQAENFTQRMALAQSRTQEARAPQPRVLQGGGQRPPARPRAA